MNPVQRVPGTESLLSTQLIDALKNKPFDAVHGGVVVVPAREVEARARHGYALALVVPSQALVYPSHNGTACEACGAWKYNGGGHTGDVPALADVPLFVMVRSKDAEREDLASKLASAREEASGASRRWEEAEHKLRTVEKERDDAQEARDDVKRKLEVAQRAAIARADTMNGLELALAKVRRAIGDNEWKRITGGDQ